MRHSKLRNLGLAAMGALVAFTFQARVYYGKLDGAKKPAELTAAQVFQNIPEYREIMERGLTKDDPEYFALLNKANQKFFNAVRKAASDNGRDVVVEKGSTPLDGDVVDLTQQAISSIGN